MQACQPTDQAMHAENFALLIANPDVVARQLGGATAALGALGSLVKADCLCWPLSVCPPAWAAHLYAALGHALFGPDHTPTRPRRVRD